MIEPPIEGLVPKRVQDPEVREFQRALYILIVLPALIAIGVFALKDVEASERYHVDLSRSVPDPPDWSGAAAVKAHVQDLLSSVQGVSIFEPNLGFEIRQIVEGSPWVARVREVRRVFPGEIQIDLDYRRPYAAVRSRSGYRLVDENGEILPLELPEPPVEPPYLSFRNVTAAEEARPGFSRWYAAAVKEGTAVITDLEKQPPTGVFSEILLDEIDLSNFDGIQSSRRPEVVLLARPAAGPALAPGEAQPLRILWGRSTRNARAAVERPIAKKLANLKSFLENATNLNLPQLIDVRFDSAYVVPGVEDSDRQ